MNSKNNTPALDWENEFVRETLLDGTSIFIRTAHPGDEGVLQHVIKHLSPDSRYFRYLTPKAEPAAEEMRDFTKVSLPRHVALLAYTIENERENYLGIGEFFDEHCGASAELAFAVEEAHQGRGIATLLLHHLTQIARQAGIRYFLALVHPENTKMLNVLRNCGLPAKFHNEHALVEVLLDISSPTNHKSGE